MKKHRQTLFLAILVSLVAAVFAAEFHAQADREAYNVAHRERDHKIEAGLTLCGLIDDGDLKGVQDLLASEPDTLNVIIECRCYGCDSGASAYYTPLNYAESRGKDAISAHLVSLGAKRPDSRVGTSGNVILNKPDEFDLSAIVRAPSPEHIGSTPHPRNSNT